MTTLYDLNGNVRGYTSVKDAKLAAVKEKVARYCFVRNSTVHFTELCLSLATYDYCGAPSNWNIKISHHVTIFNWATWIIETRSSRTVKDLIKQYRKGKVPDATNLMLDFFC